MIWCRYTFNEQLLRVYVRLLSRTLSYLPCSKINRDDSSMFHWTIEFRQPSDGYTYIFTSGFVTNGNTNHGHYKLKIFDLLPKRICILCLSLPFNHKPNVFNEVFILLRPVVLYSVCIHWKFSYKQLLGIYIEATNKMNYWTSCSYSYQREWHVCSNKIVVSLARVIWNLDVLNDCRRIQGILSSYSLKILLCVRWTISIEIIFIMGNLC